MQQLWVVSPKPAVVMPPFFKAKNLHCNPIVLFMHARQRAARVHVHVCAPEPGSVRTQIGGSDRPDVFTSCQARAKYKHCKKRLAIFPSPAGMSLTKLSLALNLIIPGQGRENL